jgi:glycosyltransferase involved in cell wall biosynthesis
MRVLHISSTLKGGSGIAARRLHEAQLNYGMKSSILTLSSDERDQDQGIHINQRNSIQRSLSKAVTAIQSLLVAKNGNYVTPMSRDTIDFRLVTSKSPDLIHIHTFYNLMNARTLGKIADTGIPVVFTLHDQRMFTGGCHYSRGCRNFEKSCSKCPQAKNPFQGLVAISQRSMKDSVDRLARIALITPSMWLAELSYKSSIFENREHTVIPNAIPSFLRLGIDKENSRPQNTIGFIAADLNNPIKNLSKLIQAMKILDTPESNLELVLAGEGEIETEFTFIKTKRVRVHSRDDLKKFYLDLNILVVPSLEDNSPNVIAEAQMCGTKVLASKVGGIPELLNHQIEQMFDPLNPSEIAEAIVSNLGSYNSEDILNSAIEKHEYSVVAKRHLDLYENLISS